MTSKYIEQLHGSGSQEKIILGSSDGTIQVEAVRLDKVRRKLAVLENLRQVSLDNENVAKADPPGTINKTCPSAFFAHSICMFSSSGTVTPPIQRHSRVGSVDESAPQLGCRRPNHFRVTSS